MNLIEPLWIVSAFDIPFKCRREKLVSAEIDDYNDQDFNEHIHER